MKQTINIADAHKILNYIIDNNRELAEQGKKLNAISLSGTHGIGKTAIIEQVAKERDMTFSKLVLSQCEEIGDLLGIPLKEYYLCSPEGDNCEWVSADVVEYYIKSGWSLHSNDHRMSYAVPKWVPQVENPNGTLILIDDWTRALPIFIQSVMELIDKQEFMSWKLPKGTTIVLSSNPDNGDYNITSIDEAQRTRYIEFEMEFDVKEWAKWAEREGIRGSGINFALSTPEIFKKENNVQKVTARNFTSFINAISGMKDWSDTKNLAFILQIAQGCFSSDDTNTVGHMFTMFINNKLDKLISPEDMLTKTWDHVKRTIHSTVYDKGVYRADIAALLSIRFLNYTMYYFDNKGKSETVVQRILDFVESDEVLLAEDMIFHLIKQLNSKYPTRVTKLMTNPKVIRKVVL